MENTKREHNCAHKKQCLSLPTFVYVCVLQPADSWGWMCIGVWVSLDREGVFTPGVQHVAKPPYCSFLSVSLYHHFLYEQEKDDGECVIRSLGGLSCQEEQGASQLQSW